MVEPASSYHQEEKKDIKEKFDAKKLKRRIANRDSARLSRKKNKDHLEQLEAKVASLMSQVQEGELELAVLKTTNESLKNEIFYLAIYFISLYLSSSLHILTTWFSGYAGLEMSFARLFFWAMADGYV